MVYAHLLPDRRELLNRVEPAMRDEKVAMWRVEFPDMAVSDEYRVPDYELYTAAFDDVPGAVLHSKAVHVQAYFELKYLVFLGAYNQKAGVVVGLGVGDEVREATAYGDCLLEAAYDALDCLTRVRVKLEDLNVDSVSEGPEMLSKAWVRGHNTDYLNEDHFPVGEAIHANPVAACVLAYLNVVNQVVPQRREAARYQRVQGLF